MYDYSDKPELNITPLVDIMLVLLTLLMVTASTVQYDENIQLPLGSKTLVSEQNEKVDLVLMANRQIKLNNQQFSFESLANNFTVSTKTLPKTTPVSIKADKSLLYQDIMSVLKIVKENGFTKVSLVTDG